MDLNNLSMKKIRELIVFTAFLVIALWKFDIVIDVIKTIWDILSPFALGGAIAFVINVPMSFLEKKLFGTDTRPRYIHLYHSSSLEADERKKERRPPKNSRGP